MTTRPRYESLDIADTTQLLDLAPARASSLPRQQHALMSGWGGPPQCRSWIAPSPSGGSDTYVISYRVPPGVTEVDVAVLMYGDGTVTFTTSADATGTRLRTVGQPGGNEVLESARWYGTAGTLDTDNGAESGRALIVRSAVAWEWTDVNITAVVYNDLWTYALTFTPLHIPR